VSTAMTQLPTPVLSSPFDAIAERYDETFTSSTVGQAQRAAVWSELQKAFDPGYRVLDIGCGTGVDARFLADQGVDVVACDSSVQMLAVAGRRIAGFTESRSKGSVKLRRLAASEICALKNDAPFDGAFSNFGAVNCVEDMRRLASDLAVLLKPGASLLLCLMGPVCLWEIAWYLLHGQRLKAFRRVHRSGVEARLGDGAIVHVRYPGVGSMRRTFAPEFDLRNVRGIGVMVPPSYLEGWAKRLPGAMRVAVSADWFLGKCPGIRMVADHVLLRFERKTSHD